MATRSHKTFFMPLLCRSSLNDAIKPAKFNDSSTADPSSPKLSCIGQIKKRSTATTTTITTTTNNNRFLLCSLPDSATATAKSSVQSNRYTKLHKLFSGKNLISPAIDTASVTKFNSKSCITKRSKSCNDRGTGRVPISKKKGCISSDDHDIVRVMVNEELNSDLDPPLPVVKCRQRDQEVNVTLWKRRGIEMKTLQIQPIQLSMINQNTCNGNGDINGRFSVSKSAPLPTF